MDASELSIYDVFKLSRELAAGGECAVSVLSTIGQMQKTETREAVDAIGLTDLCASMPMTVHPLKKRVEYGDGELVLLEGEAREKGEKPVFMGAGYWNQKTNKMVELVRFVERDGEAGTPVNSDTYRPCSLAYFMPGRIQGLDLDFSTVATKVDEEALFGIASNMHDTPLTNKEVLDELASVLVSAPNKKLHTFAEMIQLADIIKRLGLDEAEDSLHPAIDVNSSMPQDPLHRALFRIASLRDYKEPPALSLKREYSGSETAELTMDSGQRWLARLVIKHAQLGVTGRVSPMGSLQISELGIEVDSPFGNEMPLELAGFILEVPKIIQPEGLQERLQAMIKDATSAEQASNNIISEAKRSWGWEHGQIVDLGILDFRRFSSEYGVSVLERLSNVRATVLLPKGFTAFKYCNRLYECHVIGGQSAYLESTAAHCSAEETTFAFTKATNKFCTAKNVDEAFEEATSQYSYAIRCGYAFHKAESVGCVSEQSSSSFTGGSATNCRVINPRLMGRNFTRSVSHRLKGNQIQGRLLGTLRNRKAGQQG
jgi:hypothetical protein